METLECTLSTEHSSSSVDWGIYPDDPDEVSEAAQRRWCADIKPVIFERKGETHTIFYHHGFKLENWRCSEFNGCSIDFTLCTPMSDIYTRVEQAMLEFQQNFVYTLSIERRAPPRAEALAIRDRGVLVHHYSHTPEYEHDYLVKISLTFLRERYHQDLFNPYRKLR